jgi:hypothetical protein|tara:strand:+ start:23699 stop:23890 length:192 start_codon:yes stop_codon:yes gene_type:complete
MSKQTKTQKNSKNRVHLLLLPEEPMLGIKIINAPYATSVDDVGRVYGLEIGLFFFTLIFMRIR